MSHVRGAYDSSAGDYADTSPRKAWERNHPIAP